MAASTSGGGSGDDLQTTVSAASAAAAPKRSRPSWKSASLGSPPASLLGSPPASLGSPQASLGSPPRRTSWAAKGMSEGTTPPRKTSWATGRRATVAVAEADSPKESQQGGSVEDATAQEATSSFVWPSSPGAAAEASPASRQHRNSWRAAAKAAVTHPDTSDGREAMSMELHPDGNSTSDSGGGASTLAAAWRARKSNTPSEKALGLSVGADAEAGCNGCAESGPASSAGEQTAGEEAGSTYSGSETFEDRPAEDSCEPASPAAPGSSVLGDFQRCHVGQRQRRATAPPTGMPERSSGMRRVSARQPMQRQSHDVTLRLREQEAENLHLEEQLDQLRADMEVLRREKMSLQLHSTELDRQHQEELSILRSSLDDKQQEVEQLLEEKRSFEPSLSEKGSGSLMGSLQKLRQDTSMQRAPSEDFREVEVTRLQRENTILRGQLEAAVELRDRLAKSSSTFGLRGSGDDNLHQCLAQLQEQKHQLELRNSDLEASLQKQELQAGTLRSTDGESGGSLASPEKFYLECKTPDGKHALMPNDARDLAVATSQGSEGLLRVSEITDLQKLRELAAALQSENEKLKGQVGEVAKLHDWLQRADPDTPGRDEDCLLESRRNLDALFLREESDRPHDTAAEGELAECRKRVDSLQAHNKRLEEQCLKVQQDEAHASECWARELGDRLEAERTLHAQHLAELCAEEQSCHSHQLAAFREAELAASERQRAEVDNLHAELQTLRGKSVQPGSEGEPVVTTIACGALPESNGSTDSIKPQREKWGQRRRNTTGASIEANDQQLLEIQQRRYAELEGAFGELRSTHGHLEMQEQTLRGEACRLEAEEQRLTELLLGSEAHASLQDATVQVLRNEESRLEAREEVYQSLASELKAERNSDSPLMKKRRSQELREEEFLDLTDEIHKMRTERQKVLKYSDEMQQSLHAKDAELAGVRTDMEKLQASQQVQAHQLHEEKDEVATKFLSEVEGLKSEHEQSLLRAQEAREWKCGKLEGQINKLRTAHEIAIRESQERLHSEESQIHDIHSEKIKLQAEHAQLQEELLGVHSRFKSHEQDLLQYHQTSLASACSEKSVLESHCAELRQVLRTESGEFKCLEHLELESSERHEAMLHGLHSEKTELEAQHTELETVFAREHTRFAGHEANLTERHAERLAAVCHERAELEAERAELLKVSAIEQDLANRNADALFSVQGEKALLEEQHAEFRKIHGQELVELRGVLEDARQQMISMAVCLDIASKREAEEEAKAALSESKQQEFLELRDAHRKLREENRKLEDRLCIEASMPAVISPIQAGESPSAIMSLPGDSHEGSIDGSVSSAEVDKVILADDEPWPSCAKPDKLVLEALERLGAMQKVVAAGTELPGTHSECQRDSQCVAAVHIHIYMRKEECNNLSGTFTYVFV